MTQQLELGIPRVVLPATEMPMHGAVISPCGLYRYILTRSWDPTLPFLVFCMLNPSTADGSTDDPTIRKCCGFAKRLGYGGIIVVNLFAFRATKPVDLIRQPREVDIVGPDNDAWIKHAFGLGARTPVAGWGAFPHSPQTMELRVARIRELAKDLGATLHAIGVNEKSRTPRHPLMTAYETPMTEWRAA